MHDEQIGRLWTAHHERFSNDLDASFRRLGTRLRAALASDPPFSRLVSVLAAFAATLTTVGTTLA